MRLGRYDPRPSWFSKSLHRVGMFWAVVIGFPVIIYVFDKVAVYILGFAVIVAIYAAAWNLWNRRK